MGCAPLLMLGATLAPGWTRPVRTPDAGMGDVNAAPGAGTHRTLFGDPVIVRTPLLALATLLAASARPLTAQDEEDFDVNDAAAYGAITNTPVGALPPTLAAQLAGGPPVGMRLRGAVGYLDEEGPVSRRILGLGVDVPLAHTTLGLTAGLIDYACDEDEIQEESGVSDGFEIDCNRGLMAGASWFAPLVAAGLGSGGTTFRMGVDATLGMSSLDLLKVSFADPDIPEVSGSVEETGIALSAGVGVPLGISGRSGALTLTPYVVPRFMFGRLTDKVDVEGLDGILEDDEVTESGSRFMLGGGLGIRFDEAGFGLDVGFQHVFLKDAKTLIGVGFTYGGR